MIRYHEPYPPHQTHNSCMHPLRPSEITPYMYQHKVRRVTTELKRYQLRYPRAAAEAAAAAATEPAGGSREVGNSGGAEGLSGHTRQDAVDDLPPWVTSSEVMSPLLTAYDSRIQVRPLVWQACRALLLVVRVGDTDSCAWKLARWGSRRGC